MKWLAAAIVIVLLMCGAFESLKSKVSFKYFVAGCSLFDTNGKVLFTLNSDFICIFKKDGSVIATNPVEDRLTYYDKSGEVIWTSRENATHDLRFIAEESRFLTITSEVTDFDGTPARGDCVSERDMTNRILKQWCFSKNRAELEIRRIRKGTDPVNVYNNTHIAFPNIEISHANSISVIPANAREAVNPAFAEGNYLVNLYTPGFGVIILDRDMKHILWSRNLRNFQYKGLNYRMLTHDLQVTKEGNILAYVNAFYIQQIFYCDVVSSIADFVRPQELISRYIPVIRPSHLVEFDPETDHIVMDYTDQPPEKFHSELLGSVNRFSNGHYLYSDTTNGGAAFEVDKNGKKVWSFVNPIRNSQGRPAVFQFVRPMNDDSFLKARGIETN